MKVLGFSDAEYKLLIDIIVGIVNLGNVQFEEVHIPGTGDQAQVTSETKEFLERASEVF